LLRAPQYDEPNLLDRMSAFPGSLLFLLLLVGGIGMAVLYSAVGGGENVSLMLRQMIRFAVALVLMFIIALGYGTHFYRRHAYLIYFGVLLLLVGVLLAGSIGMGARRWLDLGMARIQPSELMKVALVLALARFFHDRKVVGTLLLRDLWMPLLMVALPLVFIVKQPDLGTAVLLGAIGGLLIFTAGLSWTVIFLALILFGVSLPWGWYLLHDYQRQRIMTLFHPEEDPLGSGYHIIQSKIAVGSGGLTGKGFMGGSQSHLNFLPEQHTDFIFSVLAEEWGFLGACLLLLIYAFIILRGLYIAASARDRFGLLVATGLVGMFSFHVVVNIGMVIGLLPVVGIPLPLISYGGSSLFTIMLAMGLIANIHIQTQFRVQPD
jgi:rod shape determining protein RodA